MDGDPGQLHDPASYWRRQSAARLVDIVFGLSIGLLLVVVAAKLVLLPFPVDTPLEFVRWVLRLAIVVAADVAFVAVVAAVCCAVGWAVAGRPLLCVGWRLAVIALFQALGLYAVATVPMFRVTMVPLTVELLSFAGGPQLMASSIAGFITPPIVAALALVPTVLCAAAWWSARRWRFRPTRSLRPGALVTGVVLALVYASVARAYVLWRWTDPNRWERRIACSAHTVFLSSCVAEALKPQRLTLSYDPTDRDESDFTTANTPATRPQPPERLRNLIVVVMESVGVEYLGLYGSPHATTPHLERLIDRGGAVFENVYCHAPSSPKGLVALTAGVIPRVDWRLITRDSPEFDVPTLPGLLAGRGYRTCYIHGGYWSWKQRDRYLSDRGVQRLVDAGQAPHDQVFSWGMSDDRAFAAALDFIDEDPRSPFHLLIWTIETHHPYVAPADAPPFAVDDPELARYLAAVRATDARIGDLVESLARRGLDRDTVIAVTGDHGKVFGQHQQRVHSFGIYEENVRVPLVVLDPRLDAPARHWSGVAQQIDVPATLLGRLGYARPRTWQGRDLIVEGARPRAYFFSTGNEVLLGVRDGRWKYHFGVGSGREELFDLAKDPNETENLAAARPDACARFRRRVGGLVTHQRRFLAAHGSH